ncbi:putative ABC transport system ATP-binding protein [Antricoccus suffuscus]|uniref:Putative ABC transport system ATP-binding protein n=1 Tax=Antricoccus suffuscus TaxID=1629062 RepID=A0A2T1A435_9ACTN|nr:putative ABC transport system ATP-binding protein [Antricoccus suffuscus]
MLLEVRNLGARFGDIALFSGVDVVLEPGVVLVVESEIELARTTFLELVAGITMPTTGSIAVNGAPVGGGLAGQVASVLHDEGFPQDEPVAVHLQRVLADYAADPVAAAVQLLERVRLTHRAEHEPWAMSAGEYRRIALELAFSVPKKLLVLDEPERRLDRPSVEWVIESVRAQVAGGAAVVLATYDERLGDLATRRLELVSRTEMS